jgi:YVTN family beta-propeller protein
VIDIASSRKIAVIEVGGTPEGIDITPDGQHVYVANWGDGSVSVIDTDSLQVVDTIDSDEGSRAFGSFIW